MDEYAQRGFQRRVDFFLGDTKFIERGSCDSSAVYSGSVQTDSWPRLVGTRSVFLAD